MNKRRNMTFALIGVSVLAVTLFIFFMLTTERTSVIWVSLLFMIMAELILFGGALAVEMLSENTSKVMFRSGSYTVLAIYGAISIVTSIVFIASVKDNVKVLSVIQVSLIALLTILLAIIFTSSKSVGESDKKILSATSKMKGLENKVMLLQSNKNYSAYYKKIGEVIEAIRYADTSTTVPIDDIVGGKIGELEINLFKNQENKDKKIIETIDEILLLMKERTNEVKDVKRGGV